MLTVNFVGCGKLGKTIAHLLHNQSCQINGVVNSTFESAKNAVEFIGQGIPFHSTDELPSADIYFITTPDDLIQATCDKLLTENKLKAGDILVHCSGSLSSDVFENARKIGCFVASVHPIKSFADPNDAITNFNGTDCAVEGDDKALEIVIKLFENIQGNTFKINKENKVWYHLGGVISSNFLVALHNEAFQAYQKAGIDDEKAKILATKLMLGTINNINNKSHQNALTGPLQRGDLKIIEKHLNTIHPYPLIKKLYKTFGLLTIPLTKHSPDKKNRIISTLNYKKNM